MKICRLFRHIVQTRLGLHRRFPAQTLDAIEAAVHRGELRHDGEVRFAVEAELDLPALWRDQTPRERALEVFAHLGVWRALDAHGVEIDYVGGTSIGALMATLIAADAPVERAIGIARRAFGSNPTSDYNVLPLVSLIKGRRVRHAIDGALDELVGGGIDIEDLWKPFFCVATNYSQAREQDVRSGDLARSLLASIAIPGALPPVVRDGDLLCDGGTFNNFPVDVMRDARGVGRVIGVDLGVPHAKPLAIDDVPGTWTLLRDRLRSRHRRRYRLPSLMSYLLNVTILYSVSRQADAKRLTDLYFNPPLYKVGILQWSRFDQIVRQGEQHALEVLARLSDEQRAAFRPARG